MTLQASGAISFSDLQTEYGGSNPISLDEYYKNGSYVPSTKIVIQNREPASGDYYTLNVTWIYHNEGTNGAYYFFWNGTLVAQGTSASAPSYVDAGGYRYYRGGQRANNVEGYQDWYGIYREERSEQTINTNVPTSGSIAMDDFYSGQGN